MLMRVATFSMNERMLNASMRTQAKMAEMQIQQATQVVSTDYSGLGSSSRALINLDISYQRSITYEQSANAANERVLEMISALDGVDGATSILSKFKDAIVALRSTDRSYPSSVDLIQRSKYDIESFANKLNKQLGGRYLFGGSETTSAPVDAKDPGFLAADPASGVPNDDYYLGDDFISQVQVSADHTVTYGVTANEEGFEEALRAMRMIATADPATLDDDTLKAALELAVEAFDKMTVVSSRLAVTSGILQDAVASQQQYQFSVTINITNIKAVDPAELMLQLANYKTQLMASFSALAEIQSVNLVDYLR